MSGGVPTGADRSAALAPMDDPEVTTDRLFDGRIVLRQSRRGHRAGTDAVLLAAAVEGPVAGTVIDVGAGSGAVGIAIAARSPQARVILVENDAAAASLACSNLELNGLGERGSVAAIDVLDSAARRKAALLAGGAALVVTNPPYYAAGQVRGSPDGRRAHAHVMPDRGNAGTPSLIAWIEACVALLAPKGRFAVIHRPGALGAIFEALRNTAGNVRITPVLPHAEADATRILVTAVKGARGPTQVAAPIVMHEPDGRFTEQAERLHRGTGA